VVGVEVGYGVIPLVPVHVDHHTVERADSRHEMTIAEVQTGQALAERRPCVRRYLEAWLMTC
jgi:hypothetical protein